MTIDTVIEQLRQRLEDKYGYAEITSYYAPFHILYGDSKTSVKYVIKAKEFATEIYNLAIEQAAEASQTYQDHLDTKESVLKLKIQ